MNAEFHHCTCDSTPYLFRGLLATLPDGVIERPGEEVGRGVSEAAGELLRELDSGHGLVAVIVRDERLQARAAVVGAAAIENGMRDKCIDRGKNLPPRTNHSPCTGPAAEDVIVVHQFVKRWPAFNVVICRRSRRQLSSSATGMQVELMASVVC